LGVKEKYVRKSLQFLISQSNKKIAKYDSQLRQMRLDDDPARLSIQGNRAKEEARKAEISQRLKDRLAEIDQEKHLSEKPPEILGVAVILPSRREVVASVEGMESDPAAKLNPKEGRPKTFSRSCPGISPTSVGWRLVPQPRLPPLTTPPDAAGHPFVFGTGAGILPPRLPLPGADSPRANSCADGLDEGLQVVGPKSNPAKGVEGNRRLEPESLGLVKVYCGLAADSLVLAAGHVDQ